MSHDQSSAVVGSTPTGLLDHAILQHLDSQELVLDEDIFRSLPVDEILRNSDPPSAGGSNAAPIDRLFLRHMKQELWKSASSHQRQQLVVNTDQEHPSEATILTTAIKEGKDTVEPTHPSDPATSHNKTTSRRGRTRTRRESCTNAAMRGDELQRSNQEMTDTNCNEIEACSSQIARKLWPQIDGQPNSNHSANSTGESPSQSDSDHEEREQSSVPSLRPVSSKSDEEEDIRQPASSKSFAVTEELSFVDGSNVDSAASYSSHSGKPFNSIKMNKARTVTRTHTVSIDHSNNNASTKSSPVIDVSKLSQQQLEIISNAVEAHFAPKFDALQASLGGLDNSVIRKKESCNPLAAITDNDEQNSTVEEPPVLAPHMIETLTTTMETHFAPRFERIETSLREIQETLAAFSQPVVSASASASLSPPPTASPAALPAAGQSELPPVPLVEKSKNNQSAGIRYDNAVSAIELEHQKEMQNAPDTRLSLSHESIAITARATVATTQPKQHSPLETSTKTKSAEAAESIPSQKKTDSNVVTNPKIRPEDVVPDNGTQASLKSSAESSEDELAKSAQTLSLSTTQPSEEKSPTKPFRPDRIISKANKFLSRRSRFSTGAANRSIFAFTRQRSSNKHPQNTEDSVKSDIAPDDEAVEDSVKSDIAPDDEAVEDLAKASLAPDDEKRESAVEPIDAAKNTVNRCVQFKGPVYSVKNGNFCKDRTSEYMGAKVAQTASDCKISSVILETDISASVSSPDSPMRPRRLQYRPAREMRVARIRDEFDAKLNFQGDTISCESADTTPSGRDDLNEKDYVSVTLTLPGRERTAKMEMSSVIVSPPCKNERLKRNDTTSEEDAVTLKDTADICTKPAHEKENDKITLGSESKFFDNNSKSKKGVTALALSGTGELSATGPSTNTGASTFVQPDADTEVRSVPSIQTEVATVLSSPSDEADEVINSAYEFHLNRGSTEKRLDHDEKKTTSQAKDDSSIEGPSRNVETALSTILNNQDRPKRPTIGRRNDLVVSQDPPFIDGLQYQSHSFPRPCDRIDDAMLNYLEFIPTDEEDEDLSTTTDYDSPINSILASSNDKKDSTSSDITLVPYHRVEAEPPNQPGSEYQRLKNLLQHSQRNETISVDRPAEIMFREQEWAITSPSRSTVSDSVSHAQPSSFQPKKPRETNENNPRGQQACNGIEQQVGSVVWTIPGDDSKKTGDTLPFNLEESGKFLHNNPSFNIIAKKIAEAEVALKVELARDSEMYNKKKLSYRRRYRCSDENGDDDFETGDAEDGRQESETPVDQSSFTQVSPRPAIPGPTTTILTDSKDRYIELVHVSSAALFDNPISPTPSAFSIEASLSSSEESSSNHWLVKECKALAKKNARLPFLERFKNRTREEWQPSSPGVVETEQEGHQILLAPSAKSKTQDEHFLTSYSSTTTSSNPPSSSSSIDLDPMGDILDDENTEQDAAQILEIVERYYHYHSAYGAGKAEHFALSLEEKLQQPLDQLLIWTMVAFEEIENDFLTSFHEKATEGTVGYHDKGNGDTGQTNGLDTNNPTLSTDNPRALNTEANVAHSTGIMGEDVLDVIGHPPQQLGVFNQDHSDQDQASQTPSRSFNTNSNSPSSSFEDGSSDTSLFSGDEEDDDSEDVMTAEVFQSILSAIQEEGPSYDADSKHYYEYDY